MSARNWTPGPWYPDITGLIWRRPVSDLYQHGGSVAGDQPLATAYVGWSANGYPVAANARLIAAAPALYEALAATPCTCTTVAGASHGGQTEQLLDEQCARCAALALADGEQS